MYYFCEGFLHIQDAIARSYINQKCTTGEMVLPEVQMHQFPTILNKYDVDWLGNLVGILMLVAFSVLIMNIVTNIVAEKERQIKNMLQIIGVSNYLYWGSWCVFTMVYLVTLITVMVAMMKVFKICSFFSKIF